MLDQIKSLMEKHDWYFEYTEDHKQWQAGLAEKQKIVFLLRRIPMRDIPELMKLVPEKLRDSWMSAIQRPEND